MVEQVFDTETEAGEIPLPLIGEVGTPSFTTVGGSPSSRNQDGNQLESPLPKCQRD